jgi:PleD family two-component response regulator
MVWSADVVPMEIPWNLGDRKRTQTNTKSPMFSKKHPQVEDTLSMETRRTPMTKENPAVDDEKQIVDIVRAYLEKDGYRVVAAYDGRQALRLRHAPLPYLSST